MNQTREYGQFKGYGEIRERGGKKEGVLGKLQLTEDCKARRMIRICIALILYLKMQCQTII